MNQGSHNRIHLYTHTCVRPIRPLFHVSCTKNTMCCKVLYAPRSFQQCMGMCCTVVSIIKFNIHICTHKLPYTNFVHTHAHALKLPSCISFSSISALKLAGAALGSASIDSFTQDGEDLQTPSSSGDCPTSIHTVSNIFKIHDYSCINFVLDLWELVYRLIELHSAHTPVLVV